MTTDGPTSGGRGIDEAVELALEAPPRERERARRIAWRIASELAERRDEDAPVHAEARAAVAAVRYAPPGARGMVGTGRVAAFGDIPREERIRRSSEHVLLALMIEDAEPLQEVDVIAATEGVDVVPSDLSDSLGAGTDAARLDAAIQRIADAAKKCGNARLGLPIGNAAYPCDERKLKALGVAYAMCGPGPHVRLLRSYLQQIPDIRPHWAGESVPGRSDAAPARSH